VQLTGPGQGETSQRFSSVDEETKLHKTMSQGEITKLAVRQKASDSDIRPQRAKMRFWAKGKQGEKKTTRVKAATQSEVSGFFAGSDMIPAHQFPDGKMDKGWRLSYNLFTLSESSLFL